MIYTDSRQKRNTQIVSPADSDPVGAAEMILRRYGARAISLLTSARQIEEGRLLPARLSANDCYVALEEACRKMARVAVRKFRQQAAEGGSLAERLDTLFPDPVAYLARAIKSVISDHGRVERREIPTVPLEQPIGPSDSSSPLHLMDTLAETRTWKLPDQALMERDERAQFRLALKKALKTIPQNYLQALLRDLDRERQRQQGVKIAPETDRERQTLCRARAALTQIIRRECDEDNPFVRLLAQQRSSRVPKKTRPSSEWSGERQDALFRRLMQTSWTERAAERSDDSVEEAVVNYIHTTSNVAPPSPEFRQAMRVLDLYKMEFPTPQTPAAQELYARARSLRQAGKIEESLRCYKACYDAEPTFFEALNEVGVLYSQLGNLRDALKVYLSIIERDPPGGHKYRAATNAADIYLTWFDTGRNRERNIERATFYAKLAMERPTPMRACNLILAYVKDRYYEDARKVMETALRENSSECPAEKFLQTLFQIRDADLIGWWDWLDRELAKE
jgi:tetratricopeptide (TPR) repeat protein